MENLNTSMPDMENMSNEELTQKKEEIKRLKDIFLQTISFKLQNFTKELEHVKSRFIKIESAEWDIALFLPTERFQKSSKQTVWKDSRAEVRGR